MATSQYMGLNSISVSPYLAFVSNPRRARIIAYYRADNIIGSTQVCNRLPLAGRPVSRDRAILPDQDAGPALSRSKNSTVLRVVCSANSSSRCPRSSARKRAVCTR